MNLFVVDQFTVYIHSETITEAHGVMYDGTASRPPRERPPYAVARIGNDVREPLHVIRSKNIIPDVFKPGSNFVVSEVVRDKLSSLPNLEFLEVVFDRLVDFYYEKGDGSFYYESDTLESPGERLVELPDCPEAHEDVGRFFELINAKNSDIVDNYDSVERICVEIGRPKSHDPVVGHISKQMMTDYPILKVEWGFLFNEEAYRLFEPHIDWDYFLRREIEI